VRRDEVDAALPATGSDPRLPSGASLPDYLKDEVTVESDSIPGYSIVREIHRGGQGVVYEAIQKALEKDLKAKKFKFGGSTITQQLARNLYLSPEKSIIRKISEAIITWRMEKVLSKKRILELYLNTVEWGEGIMGAESASRKYFCISSSHISPSQAALLSAILPNPKRWSPISDRY
jgi:membrane peptidoglycan carboxypeptidase